MTRLRQLPPKSVVHGVSAVREGLWGCEVRVRPVWFGGRGGSGRHMLARGHGRAAGGRHWAGGLHSRGMLLLVGTNVIQALLPIVESEGPVLTAG